MLLFLCGMPGSGKTTVGKELSKLLNSNLIDLDEYIAKKEKLAIPIIFKTKGEDYFRKAESACLKELIEKNHNAVVSVGGGTPCFGQNMKVMSEGGKTIYLKAKSETLCKHIEEDKTARPLFAKFKGEKLKDKIASMLSHRERHYLKATVSFDTEGKTPADIAKEITALF